MSAAGAGRPASGGRRARPLRVRGEARIASLLGELAGLREHRVGHVTTLKVRVGLLEVGQLLGVERRVDVLERTLAQELGVSEIALSKWKTGSMPRRRNLEALLELLQVWATPQPAATALGHFVAQVAALQPSLEGLAAAAPDLLRVLQEAEARVAQGAATDAR